MIDTKELRIGNLVDIYKGNVIGVVKNCIVEQIDTCSVNHFDNDDIEPIPLTSEQLLKFGYNEINQDNIFGLFGLRKGKAGKYCLSYLSEHCLTIFEEIIVEYIHQFQNLHFTLTGEEPNTSHLAI